MLHFVKLKNLLVNRVVVNLEPLRIAFVLGSRFPTSRAYGVTTRETLEVLLEHSICFKVFCFRSSYTDKDFDKVVTHVNNMRVLPLSKVLRFLSNFGNSRLNYIIWRLALFLDLCFNLSKIKKFDPNIIWTRDPFIAYLLLKVFPQVKIAIEVHESVGKRFYRKLIHTQRVKFFPINKENRDFLCNLLGTNRSYEIMPMGVRIKLIPSSQEIIDYVSSLNCRKGKVLTIGYIGAFEPNGYSKGVEDLVDLAHYLQDHQLPYRVKLVGASKSELQKYIKVKNKLKLLDSYLTILPHMTHSAALTIMNECDVLILPAYKSKRYMGMPIKLLEYLISGKVTFIGDCELYRNILPSYLYPLLFPSSEPKALLSFIKTAIDSKDLEVIIELSVNFASDFTWEKRTLRILEAITA